MLVHQFNNCDFYGTKKILNSKIFSQVLLPSLNYWGEMLINCNPCISTPAPQCFNFKTKKILFSSIFEDGRHSWSTTAEQLKFIFFPSGISFI